MMGIGLLVSFFEVELFETIFAVTHALVMSILVYSEPVPTTVVASRDAAPPTMMTSIENPEFLQTLITMHHFFGRPPRPLRYFQGLHPLVE